MNIHDMTNSLEKKYSLNETVQTKSKILNESYDESIISPEEELESNHKGSEIITEDDINSLGEFECTDEFPNKEELETYLDIDLSDNPLYEAYVRPNKNLKTKVFNNKKGTVQHASNEKRLQREKLYRNLLDLDEDFEITEDNLEPWAITRVANTKNCPEERIRRELLKQPYTGYEEY